MAAARADQSACPVGHGGQPAALFIAQPALADQVAQGVGDEGVGAEQGFAVVGLGVEGGEELGGGAVWGQAQPGDDAGAFSAKGEGFDIAQLGQGVDFGRGFGLVDVSEGEFVRGKAQGDKVGEAAIGPGAPPLGLFDPGHGDGLT